MEFVWDEEKEETLCWRSIDGDRISRTDANLLSLIAMVPNTP